MAHKQAKKMDNYASKKKENKMKEEEKEGKTRCPDCGKAFLGEYRSVGGFIGKRSLRIISYCHMCNFENVHEIKITERDWAKEVGLQ